MRTLSLCTVVASRFIYSYSIDHTDVEFVIKYNYKQFVIRYKYKQTSIIYNYIQIQSAVIVSFISVTGLVESNGVEDCDH
jgi:hypothetical protein